MSQAKSGKKRKEDSKSIEEQKKDKRAKKMSSLSKIQDGSPSASSKMKSVTDCNMPNINWYDAHKGWMVSFPKITKKGTKTSGKTSKLFTIRKLMKKINCSEEVAITKKLAEAKKFRQQLVQQQILKKAPRVPQTLD